MEKFNNLEEMQPYFNKNTNTYEFVVDGILNGIPFGIEIDFDLRIDSNIIAGNIKAENINALDIKAWDISAKCIDACNIDACNINAWNIKACNIDAEDIKAWDIDALDFLDAEDIKALNIKAEFIRFNAVCFANQNIICKAIRGWQENSRYFTINGNVIIKED